MLTKTDTDRKKPVFGGGIIISKIIKVTACENFIVEIAFDEGSVIRFHMESLVRTMSYAALRERSVFARVRFEEKTLRWDLPEQTVYPVSLTLDQILFSLRD
ncbi:MAG: DUF2442 domain-containing protein [Oscillospiraceae bacterium]